MKFKLSIIRLGTTHENIPLGTLMGDNGTQTNDSNVDTYVKGICNVNMDENKAILEFYEFGRIGYLSRQDAQLLVFRCSEFDAIQDTLRGTLKDWAYYHNQETVNVFIVGINDEALTTTQQSTLDQIIDTYNVPNPYVEMDENRLPAQSSGLRQAIAGQVLFNLDRLKDTKYESYFSQARIDEGKTESIDTSSFGGFSGLVGTGIGTGVINFVSKVNTKITSKENQDTTPPNTNSWQSVVPTSTRGIGYINMVSKEKEKEIQGHNFM